VASEAAGVDALDGHDLVTTQELGQRLLGTPAARHIAHLAHDESAGEDAA